MDDIEYLYCINILIDKVFEQFAECFPFNGSFQHFYVCHFLFH